MSAFFNLGSLILGFAAWIIPLACILVKKTGVPAAMLSFGACTLSLLFQLAELQHRVHLSDWSALMDTVNAVVFAAVVMATVTFLLNAAAIIKHKNNNYRR